MLARKALEEELPGSGKALRPESALLRVTQVTQGGTRIWSVLADFTKSLLCSFDHTSPAHCVSNFEAMGHRTTS